MKKLNYFIGLALSLALFSSCEKEQEEPQTPAVTQQQECLLSKVLDQNNTVLLEVVYNSSGQFIEYKDFEYGDSYAISYSNDKIISAIHSYNRSAPSNYTLKFEFNSIGFLSKSTFNNIVTGNVSLSFPVQYNSANQLEHSQIIGKDSFNQDRPRAITYYTFGNNNLVEYTNIQYSNPVDTTVHFYTSEFDTYKNPRYRFRALTASGFDWSVNNVTKAFYTDKSYGGIPPKELLRTMAYDYNNEGYPIKVTTKKADGSIESIRKYEYICN